MKLFLSYAHEDRQIAMRAAQALEAEDHRVFIDEHDLRQGDPYNQRIRDAIEDSYGFVFLISPDSVLQGRYTLSELEQAVKKWRPAQGHIFAFFARPTTQLPDCLPATTIERTDGPLPAKIAEVIAKSKFGSPRKAKILAAQSLIRAVRSLDNAIRDHFAALSAFDSSWTTDDRNQRINKVVEFANRSLLIVEVRAAYNALKPMITWMPGETDEVLSTYQLAESYLRNLAARGRSPIFTKR